MICSQCGEGKLELSLSSEWDGFAETPAYCPVCTSITWLAEESGGKILTKDQIPPFELGYEIRVVNEQSPYFNQTGYVIDKDHIHYRIKIGAILFWVPEHWVERA